LSWLPCWATARPHRGSLVCAGTRWCVQRRPPVESVSRRLLLAGAGCTCCSLSERTAGRRLLAAGRDSSGGTAQLPATRARWVRRGRSSRTTARLSSRSQPRPANSARTLLTDSREPPASWPSSAWVSPCDTHTSGPCRCPNRAASSSSRFGHPAGDVDQHQVNDCAVGAAQPAGQHLHQAGWHVRPGRPPGEQVPSGHYHHPGAGGGGDGAGARPGVEHAELTGHVSRAGHGGHRPPVAVPAGDGEPPGIDDEHVGVVDVALSEQPGAAAQGARLERGQQRGDVAGVQAAEQLSRTQDLQLVPAARPA